VLWDLRDRSFHVRVTTQSRNSRSREGRLFCQVLCAAESPVDVTVSSALIWPRVATTLARSRTEKRPRIRRLNRKLIGIFLFLFTSRTSNPAFEVAGFRGFPKPMNLISSLLAQIEQIVVGDAQALLFQGREHERPHRGVVRQRQLIEFFA